MRRTSGRIHFVSIAFSMALTFWLSVAHAQVLVHFDLPAQPLARSLKAIGTATNTDIGFSSSQVAALIAPSLKADLTVDDALTRVLIGTGLRPQHLDGHTIVIAAMEASRAFSPEMKRSGIAAPAFTQQRADSLNVVENSSRLMLAQTDTSVPENGVDSENKEKRNKAAHLEEIVVTGTYIRHADSLSPIITLTQSALVEQGYTRLDQALEDLPQNFKGGGVAPDSNGILSTGSGASSNGTYSSGVNLRGLGAGATLVLLNGRRLPATSSGDSVDISEIPLNIIDRVEIVPDGASATYGSDAIAGVVNIITKKEFAGVETGLRLDSVAAGKAPNNGAYTTFGSSWSSGSVVASLNYDKSNPLFARDRSFTSTAADPTTILPESESFAAYIALSQELTDRLTLTADVLASRRQFDAELFLPNFALAENSGHTNRGMASAQLDYSLPHDWVASLIGQYARERDPWQADYVGVLILPVTFTYGTSAFETRAEGPVLEAPGGLIRAAAGGSIRRETFQKDEPSPPPPLFVDAARTVGAAYAEVLIPLVGAANALPLIRKLTLGAAGRYDHYSDFGGTSNPKLSLRWEIIEGLSFHASYARSFRAPTLFELQLPANNYAYIQDVTDPASPSGTRTALLIDSNNPDLTAETSRSYVGGLNFAPGGSHGLKFGLSYFNIEYTKRILRLSEQGFYANVVTDARLLGSLVNLNPTQAEIIQQLSVPGRIVQNYSSGPGTPESIKAIADIGYVNVGSSRVRGIDGDARYTAESAAGNFSIDADTSYFLRYDDQITPTSPEFSILNTPYNPIRWRAKLGLQWSKRGWLAFGRVNETGSYRIPTEANCSAGVCAVGSWTTLDAGLSYTTEDGPTAGRLDGIKLALTAFNMLDRNPPYINNSSGQVGSRPGINYDPVNANALGRAVGLSFTKRWGPRRTTE